MGWTIGWSGVRFPVWAGNFSLRHSVQNSSGAHPLSYPVGTGSSFPGGKAAGAWNWPRSSIQWGVQRMRGAIPPLPQYVFLSWWLVKYRDKFTFHSTVRITVLGGGGVQYQFISCQISMELKRKVMRVVAFSFLFLVKLRPFHLFSVSPSFIRVPLSKVFQSLIVW
jgi:hypothetical protein